MDSISVPKLTISFAIEIDVEYNSFNGCTKQDVAIALAEDLENLIYDEIPSTKAAFVSITGIESDDN